MYFFLLLFHGEEFFYFYFVEKNFHGKRHGILAIKADAKSNRLNLIFWAEILHGHSYIPSSMGKSSENIFLTKSSFWLTLMLVKIHFKEAVQLSDKLPLFNSKFYQEFDGLNFVCQKLTPLAWGAFWNRAP